MQETQPTPRKGTENPNADYGKAANWTQPTPRKGTENDFHIFDTSVGNDTTYTP